MISFKSQKITPWITYILYGLFLLTLYKLIGLQFKGESQKYIQVAESLSMNNLGNVFSKHKFFFAHILYVKMILFVFQNKFYIVFFNIIISITGAELLYLTTDELFQSRRAAYIARVLTLICYPVQFWTLSAYSEPLFIFLSILLLYQVIVYKVKLPIILLTSLLLMFTRPQGLFLVSFVLMAYSGRFLKFNVLKAAAIGAVLMLSAILIMDVPLKELKQVLYAESILTSDYKQVDFSSSPNNVYQTYKILLNQIGWKELVMLEFEKAGDFFIMRREYYSWYNNLIFGFFSIFLFAGIVALMFFFKSHKDLVIALLFTLFFNLVIAVVFWNTWHNRFNILLLPILSIFIAGAIDEFLSKKSIKLQ